MTIRLSHGFTLAEVLIALALLGVIAAFTIPKIVQFVGTYETDANLKEAVVTLEGAWYSMKLDSSVPTGSGVKLYHALTAKLNTLQSGITYVPQAGCGPAATGYIIMPNGVVFQGLMGQVGAAPSSGTDLVSLQNDVGIAGNYNICVDSNGINPPNQQGVDVFWGNFNESGNFIGSGVSNQNFSWGNATTPVYNVGAVTTAVSAGSIGLLGPHLTH